MIQRQLMKPDPADIKILLQKSPNVNDADLERLWPLFLFEMLTLYLPPFRTFSAAELLGQCVIGLRGYIEDFCRFPDEALAEGWRDVRRTHKALRWPLSCDLRKACLAAQKKKVRRSRQVDDTVFLPFWQRELARILEPQVFRCWIRPLEIVTIEDDLAILSAPSSLHASWNRSHYASLILRYIAQEFPQVTGVEITVIPAADIHEETEMAIGASA